MRSEDDKAPTRVRGIETHRLPTARRLAISAGRAGHRRPALHYLMTADVTAARRLMAMSPATLSLTGFLAVTVARVAAEYPAVHAYRDWRGRLVTHRHVDVMIEAGSESGSRVVPHVVADADLRDVAEVSMVLLSGRETPATATERLFDRVPALAHVPGLLRAMHAVKDRSVRLRQRIGTVTVTSTGTRDVGEVFGVATTALTPLRVMIGSIRTTPRQTGNFIEQREILNLTLTFDHDLVDEAAAAEFATRLCDVIEHPEVLKAHGAKTSASRPAEPAAEARTVSPGVDATRRTGG